MKKQNRRNGPRIECRVTVEEKKRIVKKAKKFDQSITEHLLKASDAYRG